MAGVLALAAAAGGALASVSGSGREVVEPSVSVREAAPVPTNDSKPLLPARARENAGGGGGGGGGRESGSGATTSATGSGEQGLARGVLVPLLLVVGLACGCAWVLRRAAKASGGLAGALGGAAAPSGILEVLGRYPLARGQTLILLRVDRRVLLLSQQAGLRGSGPGLSTLAELTDPGEVASILGKVHDAAGNSASSVFRSLLGAVQRGEAVPDDRVTDMEAGVAPWPNEIILEVPEVAPYALRTDEPAELGGPGTSVARVGTSVARGSRLNGEDAESALRARIARMQYGGASRAVNS